MTNILYEILGGLINEERRFQHTMVAAIPLSTLQGMALKGQLMIVAQSIPQLSGKFFSKAIIQETTKRPSA